MNLLSLKLILIFTFLLQHPPFLNKISVNSEYANYGKYNAINGKVVYFSVQTDSNNKFLRTQTIISDIELGEEIVIDEGNFHPAIGWIDSTSVLIYKTFPESGGTLFSTNYEKALYIYDIFSRDSIPIYDVPIDSCRNNLSISNGVILYQTGYVFDNSSKLFKFDIASNEKREIIELREEVISDREFIYINTINGVIYISADPKSNKLKCLMDTSIIELDSAFTIDNLCLNETQDVVYYLVQNKHSNIQHIRSYSFKTGDLKDIYTLDSNLRCLSISPFRNNNLMLSVRPSFNIIDSDYTIEKSTYSLTLSVNHASFLYELVLN